MRFLQLSAKYLPGNGTRHQPDSSTHRLHPHAAPPETPTNGKQPRGGVAFQEGLAPTCCKPLLDEREAVTGTDELDVTAGERAALAGELHGQGGWGAGPLRQLEAG